MLLTAVWNVKAVVQSRYHDWVEVGDVVVGAAGKVPGGGTGSIAYRRAALADVGGFDESYRVPGGEDADLERRLGEAGWRTAAVRAPIEHQGGGRAARRVPGRRLSWQGPGPVPRPARHRRNPLRILGGMVGAPVAGLGVGVRARSIGAAVYETAERLGRRIGELYTRSRSTQAYRRLNGRSKAFQAPFCQPDVERIVTGCIEGVRARP